MEDPPYLHGTSAEEQSRLELMNGLLNDGSLAAVEPRPGERILELGAGTGIFAAALAHAVGGEGRVVAIERDPRQLAEASRRASDPATPFEPRQGDVYAPPLEEEEWGSFDVVHARFLLEHLARPADAVAVMVRAVRPGGRVVLVDDDHDLMRFHPPHEAMSDLWTDYALQFERQGCDPWIGRKLPALLTAAGATVERTTWIPYGGSASMSIFPALIDNLVRVVAGARDPIVAATDRTPEAFDAALTGFREWSTRADATIWYALPCAIGRRG